MNPAGLAHGLYRLHWESGGSSLAAVGSMTDRERWFAPTDWTWPFTPVRGPNSTNWEDVKSAEPLFLSDAVPSPNVFSPRDETQADRAARIQAYRDGYPTTTSGVQDSFVEGIMFGLRYVSDEALRAELVRRSEFNLRFEYT